MGDSLEVKFWGTRGSCPAPFSDRMVYGGNTSCVSVRWKEGVALFDGGTGIAAFGKNLEEAVRQGTCSRGISVSVFVTHVHLDHVAGIPLLPCLFWKEAQMHFYGPGGEGGSFKERLSRVLGPPYWPVAVDQVPAAVVWHDSHEGEVWTLPGEAKVLAMKSNHPNGGFLYRLEYQGQSVVYGLDCELGDRTDMGSFWEQYREFARDCSLLLFDAPYTQEDYPCYRGFGHSFWQQGLEMAKYCNAGHLCICHHDWGKNDEQLGEREKQLKELARQWGRPAEFAREGLKICLGGKDHHEEGA